MIGISARSCETMACKSRPFRSGRLTSSTRQFGPWARAVRRNALAESNARASQPANRINSSSDSRADTSSSTTNTIGLESGIFAKPSIVQTTNLLRLVEIAHGLFAFFKRGVHRAQNSQLAEWLEQTRRGAGQ